MKKQSLILQAMHSALDELELLLIEGENLDVDIIVDLQKRFKKLGNLLKKEV